MAELEMRHLSSFSETIFSGAFLADDDGGADKDEDLLVATSKRAHEGEDRWIADLQHDGEINGWGTTLNYTRASDEDYFQDLDSTTLQVISQSYLKQKAGFEKVTKNWDFLVIFP